MAAFQRAPSGSSLPPRPQRTPAGTRGLTLHSGDWVPPDPRLHRPTPSLSPSWPPVWPSSAHCPCGLLSAKLTTQRASPLVYCHQDCTTILAHCNDIVMMTDVNYIIVVHTGAIMAPWYFAQTTNVVHMATSFPETIQTIASVLESLCSRCLLLNGLMALPCIPLKCSCIITVIAWPF